MNMLIDVLTYFCYGWTAITVPGAFILIYIEHLKDKDED